VPDDCAITAREVVDALQLGEPLQAQEDEDDLPGPVPA
jgi:hypothetical protein